MNVSYLPLGTTDLCDPVALPVNAIDTYLLTAADNLLAAQTVEHVTITYADGSVLRFTR